jgi:hypothetical protein
MSNQQISLSVRIQFMSLVACLVLALPSFAQEDEPAPRKGSKIIDDSTKNIYGPNTSRYYFEEDFFANRNAIHFIDTARWNFHRFSYVQRYDNFYQDLGNIGTAIRPVYNQGSERIGTTSGFDSYDLYWNSETIRYYDTKSPYSNMKVILGGKGRSVTRVTFSRNITPRWNFGFNYRALLIDKQVQRQGKGDRNVRSTYHDFYSVYHTKDSAYSIFLNYRKNYHQADEYGGVLVNQDDFSYSDFFEDNAQPTLTEAESNDTRSNYHLFHQYRLGSGLQLYHKGDFYKQRNRFKDDDPGNDFYDAIVVDSATTHDEVNFKTFRNEVGVKGNLLKLFYNGYAAWRNYSMDYKYFYEDEFYLDTSDDEFYVGGSIELQVDSLIEVKGKAEWMLDERYQVQGSIRTKWFEAAAKRSVSTPTFLQQAYRGSHDVWLNTFTNVEATEVKGSLIYQSEKVSVYPGVRFSTFRKYIFFKEDLNNIQHVLPVQASGYQTWVSPELNFSFTFAKHINLTVQGLYTRILENSENAIQVPEMFVNSQLSYSNIWFKGNLDFQVGIDAHWKSVYYAHGYDPVIQQFYVQQNFRNPSTPIVDVFLNAKIRRARIFVKYNNVLMLFNNYGNIPTPYYPGIKNLLDFGFDWSFYD